MTTVTKHGEKRMKSRCGIPKRAARRNAQTAYEKGLTYEEAKGKLKKFIDTKNGTTELTDVRIWNGNVYVFYGEALITVYPIPRKYSKRELETRKRRREIEDTKRLQMQTISDKRAGAFV